MRSTEEVLKDPAGKKPIFLTDKKNKTAQAKEQRKRNKKGRKTFLEAKAKKGARAAGWQGAQCTVSTEITSFSR